jgi:hypothetical protein
MSENILRQTFENAFDTITNIVKSTLTHIGTFDIDGKNEYDDMGRITKVLNARTYNGHSVCNSCGFDMPKCWEVVCFDCHRTFCYNHISHNDSNFWICFDCLPMQKEKKEWLKEWSNKL